MEHCERRPAEGLSLNEDTGEISGTPAGEGTEVFTVMAVNDLGEDIKEFSITIAKAPETEYAVTVRDDGHGTGTRIPPRRRPERKSP